MSNTATPVWQHASTIPAQVALRGRERSWSYQALWDRAARLASRLYGAGLRQGDRVMLAAPSVPEFAAAYYGIHTAGAVAVTVNTVATGDELGYIGADAGVSLVLGWHDAGDAPARTARTLGVPYWELRTDLTGLTADSPVDAPYPTAEQDTAAILYTAGTTGRPKGAELTHGNLLACAALLAEVHHAGEADRAGTALPLHHVYGQVCVLGTTMLAGGTLTLLERFDPEELLALLRRDELTTVAGVPTMWSALLRAGGEPAGPGTLRHAASGGASLPDEVLRAVEDRFGCAMLEGYGLTETTGAATCNAPQGARKPGTVGTVLPHCEVSVRSDGGDRLPDGEIGEVYIRGPVVMKGYWNRPEATAEAFRGDWFRTGDLGVLDADGALRIVDRKQDLVVRGGYNVYPRGVEAILRRHPGVAEVAVIGVPDRHYGEEVAAVVVPHRRDAFDVQAFRSWAKEYLSRHEVPHLVSVVDELPRGAGGTILKRAIDREWVRATAHSA